MTSLRWCLLLPVLGCGEKPASVVRLEPSPGITKTAEACLPTSLAVVRPGACAAKAPDALDEALAHLGTDRCSFGFTAAHYGIFGGASWLNDPARLWWFNVAHDPAVNAPRFARRFVEHLDDTQQASMPVSAALAFAGDALGFERPPCLVPGRVPGAAPLVTAMSELIRASGGTPDDVALAADAADVPLELQQVMATLLVELRYANDAWEQPMARLSGAQRQAVATTSNVDLVTIEQRPNLADPATLQTLASDFEFEPLVKAATRLSMMVELQRLARFASTTGFSFEQSTPLGRVVLHDASAHTLQASRTPMLLLVDTGGDDTYFAAVGAVDGEVGRHVSLAVDLGGADRYAYTPVADADDGCPAAATRSQGCRLPSDGAGRFRSTRPAGEESGPVSLSSVPRQGGARLGFGLLFDLGTGNDSYQSLRFSQGYGASGVGVLYDEGGDDVYEVEAGGQGAATFGIGLLIDDSGNDTYRTYAHAQGYAFVGGVGVLLDRDGNDRYLANTGDPDDGGDPIYVSVQIPGRANDNFVQGAGFGFNSVASGGLGVLRDRRGDDVYLAAVYAQATGYWYGTGVLADGHGDDRYNGRYYVQGSGAHFGLDVFIDDFGDDTYNLEVMPRATSIGIGHDFTVSWHLDLGGNDRYRGPGLSLGGGNANGLGVLLNVGGNDSYEATGEPCLGVANLSSEVNTSAPRRATPTFGLFLDIGGTDTYRAMGSTVTRGDDVQWKNNREPPDAGLTTEYGGGVDRASGAVRFE